MASASLRPLPPAKAYFSAELFQFLRALKRHNDREWFLANKQRYEGAVRDPALAFITDFAPHLWEISPHLVADPRPTRGSLFRIYRDTRFSSDKRPYKTHVGIHFSHEVGKDAHAPGFYLHLEPGQCFAAAGLWHPDTTALVKVRSAIVNQPQGWKKATRNLELEGDSLSRAPKGFDPDHPFIEDLKRKDFVCSVSLDEDDVCSPGFISGFARACREMSPLVAFLAQALGLRY